MILDKRLFMKLCVKIKVLLFKRKIDLSQDTSTSIYHESRSKFSLLDDLNTILKSTVVKSNKETPLRHNAVETFDEFNTWLNIATGIPAIYTELESNSSSLDLYIYMSGGGCSLLRFAKVFMSGGL